MSKPYRLTPRALAALQDIADWTVREFGPAQADRYLDILLSQCEAICTATAHVRDASRFIGEAAENTLLITRAGEHFIVFENAAEEYVITDFIHARSDLPRRLGKSDPSTT